MADTKTSKKNKKNKKKIPSEEIPLKNEVEDEVKLNGQSDKNLAQSNPQNSKVRTIKKKLEAECDYISGLLSYVRIPGTMSEVDTMDSDLEDEEHEDIKNQRRQNIFVTGENRAKSHKELQERFQKKLEEIRAQRGIIKQDNLRPKLSKAMKKADRKKKEKEALKQNLIKAGKHSGNMNKGTSESQFEGVKTKDEKDGKEKIVFSKFDFVEPESGLNALKKKHMDPAAALNKIKKSKEKLQTMKDKGMNEKVSKIEDNMAWQKAMDKAGGAKLKDDVELLKKSLKKKEQKKKASKKKWEERKENIEKKKGESQKKRQDNLNKRRTDAKEKKKKTAIKKGRLIPGV
eukprot:TRINITY_DN11882_c0_g1_i1.p1 TRINITY_DN11882_c0_g1~~TRINITY_DN11882_c0_g1_i1.p1  ORF type:complete len:345 (-),score=169.12 TRINITY_DN11882_c0_g1_i1:40-1074(-)